MRTPKQAQRPMPKQPGVAKPKLPKSPVSPVRPASPVAPYTAPKRRPTTPFGPKKVR